MNEHLLDPKIIMLAGVVILVLAVLAWLYMQKRRSTTTSLRKKFGPEYERAVHRQGSERKAETKLAERQERVEKLEIRDLNPLERERFSKEWESVQSHFVDFPRGAVAEADELVSSLMKTRGYRYPISINVRPTFLSTIPGSWKTTAPRMILLSGLEQMRQVQKI